MELTQRSEELVDMMAKQILADEKEQKASMELENLPPVTRASLAGASLRGRVRAEQNGGRGWDTARLHIACRCHGLFRFVCSTNTRLFQFESRPSGQESSRIEVAGWAGGVLLQFLS